MSQTIKAHVHQDALSKTSRFFNCTMEDILIELLQNARRANAKSVRIQLKENKLTIIDDGDGISNPQSLLSFGKSQWEEDCVSLEDAAGMGFFSLSTIGATVTSRYKDCDHGWTVNIPSEAFTKPIPIDVVKTNTSIGTKITFNTDQDDYALKYTLSKLVEYYPIPVTFIHEGEVHNFLQQDFLAECIFVKEFEFGSIGIEYGSYHHRSQSINFYGLINNASLPSLKDAFKLNYLTVRIDIKKTSGLKFILPARKDFQHNQAWIDLQEAVRKTYYEYIATLDTHHFGYDAVSLAREAGFKVKDAAPLLKKFDLKSKEESHTQNRSKPVKFNDNTVLISEFDPDDYRNESANLLHVKYANALNSGPLNLFQAVEEFKGYEWYDNLPLVNKVTYSFKIKDTSTKRGYTETALIDITDKDELKGISDLLSKPDAQLLKMTVVLYEHHKDIPYTNYRLLQTNLIIGLEEFGYADDATIFVNKHYGTPPTIEETVELLMKCHFQPSDTLESDTYDTQAQEYETYAYRAAREALLTKEEATAESIEDIIRNKVLCLVGSDQTITITITPGAPEADKQITDPNVRVKIHHEG